MYPDFIPGFNELMSSSVCPICQKPLPREEMVMTSTCYHYYCSDCATQQIEYWFMNDIDLKSCAICRKELGGEFFLKPIQYMAPSMSQNLIYCWVPCSVIIFEDLQRNFDTAILNIDFREAFRAAFLLGIKPQNNHEILAPGWTNFYFQKASTMFCVGCFRKLPIILAFMSRCGHFYCTSCAAFIPRRNEFYNAPLTCMAPGCPCVMDTGNDNYFFLRPLKE